MDELREKAEEEAVLTVKRRRIWLSDGITTVLSKVDADSEYCAEESTDTVEVGEDKRIVKRKIKKVDPLRCMIELNKMDRVYSEDQPFTGTLHVVIGGNVEDD